MGSSIPTAEIIAHISISILVFVFGSIPTTTEKMTSTALVLLAVTCTCMVANAQLNSPGTCPTFKVQKNFDVTKYTGKWYENTKYETAFEKDGSCNSAEYTDLTQDGKVVIGVLNKRLDKNGELVMAKGNATLGEPDNAEKPAKIVVNFYDPPSKRVSTTPNYNVVETDYTSYTIVYFCRQINTSTKSEFLWILTREQAPPATLINKAKQVITVQGIDTNRLKAVKQKDCGPMNSSTKSMASPMSLALVAAIFALQKYLS